MFTKSSQSDPSSGEPVLLSAKPVILARTAALVEKVKNFSTCFGRVPKLAVVLVGNDPASLIYTTRKTEACNRAGISHVTHQLTEESDPSRLKDLLDSLNDDTSVDGILVQRPLPNQFREKDVLMWVEPSKDVDAFHPQSVGSLTLGLPCFTPCTPGGIMTLLDHYQINYKNRVACVVGRSNIVGRPMAQLLIQNNATVIQCHSKSLPLERFTREADILIVAAGRPHLINQTHVRPGAVVVDVGIHRTLDGKICGDVDFGEVSKIASAITPVPGGVGPMTIMTLLENTLLAATRHQQ